VTPFPVEDHRDQPAPATVLVADDSAVVRAVVREQLVAQGLAVIEAADGEQTITMTRNRMPDLVLLDVDMPVRTGHQVLVDLRGTAATRDIPVVFLTGRVTVADAVEGLRLGAHDYLRKPVEPVELLARVAAALRVKELQDQLRRSNAELSRTSRTDALTGLYNRRHLEELIAAHENMSTRQSISMALIIIDIDLFKRVNDTWGHETGDQCLCSVAHELHATMRGAEMIGRWGGEEFLAILPEASLDVARTVAERMRGVVAAASFAAPDGPVRVTISAGCAAGVGRSHELLRQADAALYEAKSAGRNTIR
jgi:two-component system cell cycle response regulator